MQRFVLRIGLIALALTLLMLACYLLWSWRGTFDSDSATKSVLAVEILKTGTFFPTDFRYVQDLWLLHGHVPLLVLIPLFGNTFFANGLSSLLFAVAFLLLVDRLLLRMSVGPIGRVVTPLLLLTGFSPMWAVHLWAQASYGYACLILVLVLLAASRVLSASPFRWYDAAAIIAAGVLIGLYGSRGVVSVAVPVAAGVWWASKQQLEKRLPIERTLLSGVGVVAGYLIRRVIISKVHMAAFAGQLGDLFWFPKTSPLSGILNAFEVVPWTPVSMRDPWAAVHPLRLAALVVVIALGVIGTRRADTPQRRLMVGCHWMLTLTTLYLSIAVTQLAGVGRYLIPPLVTGIIVGSFAIEEILTKKAPREIVAACAMVLLLLSFDTYVRTRRVDQRVDAPAQWLKAHGIRQVYATFWNAASMTVLSGGAIAARQIEFQNGMAMPYHHLSRDAWYLRVNPGPIALVIAQSEEPTVSWVALAKEVGAPSARARAGEYLILVYPSNRFVSSQAWKKDAVAWHSRSVAP